jgi:hypothetical protein
MASIKSLCEKVFWLEGGRVRRFGDATEVVNQYETESFARVMALRSGAQRRFEDNDTGIGLSEVTQTTVEGEDSATLRVRLKGHANKDVRRLKLSITLTTLEGVLISAIYPTQARAFLDDVSGAWECAFEFPDITRYLNHGEYMLGVTIKRPNLRQSVQVPQAALVHIPEVHLNGGRITASTTRGLVPLPVNFYGGNGADDSGPWDTDDEA